MYNVEKPFPPNSDRNVSSSTLSTSYTVASQVLTIRHYLHRVHTKKITVALETK